MASTISNIGINHAISYNKELVIPAFSDVNTMNGYTPARAGALAQVGTDTYKYDGSQWVKFSDTNNTGGSTYRGSINDL